MMTIRILYVDDEPDLLEISKKYLERNAEFKVDTVVRANSALEILNKEKYDAIVSDYQMPGMDGISFLKEVRSGFGDLPFILFTGRGREEIAVEALNNGADFYLQKGDDQKAQYAELTNKIKQAVSRYRAERALAESESRFRDLTENSLDTIMLFDRDLRHLYVNQNVVIETGIPASNFIGKTHEELGFPNDLTQIWGNSLRRVFESGKTDRIDFQLPSGSWIDWLVVPVKSADGSVLQVITSARDITERKQAEEQLRLAEFSLEHSGITTLWIDEDARIVRANLAATKSLGYTCEEFSSLMIHDFDPHYNKEAWKNIWQQIVEKKYLVIESLHKRKDGFIFPVEIASSYFEYGGKKLIFSFINDISERKKTENEIKTAYEQIAASEEELKANYDILARSESLTRESEALFKGLFDQAFQLTCLMDLKGNLTRVNDTALNFIGKTINEVIECPFPETPWWINNPRGQEKIRAAISQATLGETSRFETTHFDSKSHIHYIDFSIKPVLNEKAEIIALLSEGRDITERKRAEQALRIQYDLAIALNLCTNLDDALNLILSAALRIEGLDSGGIYLSDLSTGDIDLKVHYGLSPQFIALVSHFDASAIQVQRSKTGTTFYGGYADFKKDNNDKIRESEHIKSFATIPVMHEGELIAILNMASHSLDGIPISTQNTLETLAMQVSSILVRIRSQSELQESEARFRQLTEAALEGIILHKAGIIYDLNKRACHILNYTYEEMINQGILTLIAPDYMDLIQQNLSGVTPGQVEVKALRKGGSFIWVETGSHQITIHGEQVFITTFWDITERKRVEEELKKSAQNLRKISDSVPGVIYQFYARKSGDMGLYYVSERSGELFGIAGDTETFFQRFTAGVAQEDRAAFLSSIQKSIQSVEKWDFKGKFHKPSGEEIYFHAVSEPDWLGDELIFYGVIFDVTSQELAEKTRLSNEVKYQSLVETTGTGYVIVDMEGRVINANDEYVRLTGKEKLSEIQWKKIIEWTAPHDLERNKTEIEKCIRDGRVRGLEIDYVKPDGSIQPIEINASLFHSESGDIILTLCRDITERRNSEKALKEEQEFTSLLLNTTPAFFVAIRADGRVITMNKALIDVLEYSPEEIQGKDYLSTFVPEADRKHLSDVFKQIVYNGKATVNENRIISKSGKIFLVEWHGRLIGHDDKNLDFFVGVGIDITEQKKAEIELKESEKRLIMAQEIGHTGSWEYNLQTGKIWGSAEGLFLFGFPRVAGEFSLEEIEACIPERERVHQALIDLINEEKDYNLSYKINPADHSTSKFILSIARLEKDENGNPTKVIGVIQDITNRTSK